MIIRTVRLSSKGRFTLPADVLRALRLRKGSQLLLVQEGDRILLVPAERVAERVVDELGGWQELAAAAFNDLWDNPADEVWDAA